MTGQPPLVLPDDVHNRALTEQVHPHDWKNPEPAGRYNLVVLGGGTAGLVSAVGAASLGARVAIVERHLMGGDCLNVGCVPSKALLAASRVAAASRAGGEWGIVTAGDGAVDFVAVMARMRRVRAGLAAHDSVARLQGLGIDVFFGDASFVSDDAVTVDGRTLRFARAVIATGARAGMPDIPGLLDAGVLTNESVFSLVDRPRRLTVVGGGPVGCELAQAFQRFGSAVTIVGRQPRLLPREDADVSAIVQRSLARDGVRLELGATIRRAGYGTDPSTRVIVYEVDGQVRQIEGDEILVATGRTPNIETLNLGAGGIEADAGGVVVDDHLRTSNHRVYAAGDVCTRHKFTHAAEAMARIVVRNALFFGRQKASDLVMPRATYTDPEVAHVGIGSAEAARAEHELLTLTVPLTDVDRAVLEGETDGLARMHVHRRTGAIVGGTMVASHAGEMIGELALAMTAGVRAGTLSSTIHPYPTQSEAWKKLGDAWSRQRLTPRVRTVFEALLRWRR